MGDRPDIARMLVGLLDASHVVRMEEVPGLVRKHARYAGMTDPLIYVADLQQTVLRLMDDPGVTGAEPELSIEGTSAGRAFQEVRIIPRGDADGEADRWWVPILDGTERLGVLRVGVPGAGPEIGAAEYAIRSLAAMIALLLVSKRPYSDSYARLVRTYPMNIAAEMQWRLMPPLSFATRELVICGVLEPAYEIGGDVFDYAVDGDLVHLEIFDAMGHDTSAGLTAHLAVATSRNSRRQGADLVRTSEDIERVLIEEFGRAERFATGILARLHRSTGEFTWVNRGHPPPVLIRAGRRSTVLGCPPAHPMGLDLGLPAVPCREQLEPGDRVVFYTDGVVEARDAGGVEFGLHRFLDFLARHTAGGLPAPETLRRLVHDVLEYHDRRLQDDATVLVVEWHGPGYRHMLLKDPETRRLRRG